MPEIFPLASTTANEMDFQERDAMYEALHDMPLSTHRHQYGLQMIWRHDDVQEVMRAEHPDITNQNSLDPLDGFVRIAGNPRAFKPLIRHLIPFPAPATANANGPEHEVVAKTLNRFLMNHREDRIGQLTHHFNTALAEVIETTGLPGKSLDVTALSVAYATRATGQAIGLGPEDWPLIAEWSKAQSGLLGQRMRGSEQAKAIEGLGQLFTVSKKIVRERQKAPENDLASALLRQNIEPKFAVSALANCIAAGVHTVAGTLQQGTERLLHDSYRHWWDLAEDTVLNRAISQKILQLDPGLVAWKRKVLQTTRLSSGTVLHKGEVLAMSAAANRDPNVFDPYKLSQRSNTLTFGSGKHACPGRSLSQMATMVFFRELHGIEPNAQPLRQPAHDRKRDLLFSGAEIAISLKRGTI